MGCTIFEMERYFEQLYTVEIKDDFFWNLINNYKGSHEIFKDNELYDYNSFNLSRNYRTVGELISSSSYTLDTWGKTRDGYTFNFKTHESYSILFTIITMYILQFQLNKETRKDHVTE